jgi:molybdopterin converting factor small subunit
MKYLILFIPFMLFSQIPDIGSQIELRAINASLREVVAQNQMGLTTERKNLAKMITAVQNTYKSYKQLEKLNDQKEKFMKDLKAIQKYKINDLTDLKNFVLHGDQVDFWFKSSTSNLIKDIKSLSYLTDNADDVVLYANKTFSIGEIDESLEAIDKAEDDAINSDLNYVEALPDLITLQIQMAERFKKLASDQTASMSQADRAKLLLMAQDLEDKTMSRFRELQDESKKLIEKFKRTQEARKKNKITNDYVRKYLNSVSSKVSYGLFKSQKFNVKVLDDLKWGKNY